MQQSTRSGGRSRKAWVLSLGGVGLAAALTVAAFAAPDRAARAAERYTPEDPQQVIVRVPARDADELAARRALASAGFAGARSEAQPSAVVIDSPDAVDAAVRLARMEIVRYHRFSDPRYLGRAQALLGRWWDQPEPPADVLLLRATIRQAIHEFPAARADLDKLVALDPTNTQAQLTRAVVATITTDYASARESCRAVAHLPLVAAACEAPLDGIAGHPLVAYRRLTTQLAHPRQARIDAGVRTWAMTSLAELALQLGDTDAALGHLQAVLSIDDDDVYARNLMFDILLDRGRAADASKLLAGREHVDSHLVRLAISEHALKSTDAARLIGLMRERIAAAAMRGDRIHLREEARFALAVDGDAVKATATARDNWAVQKELADARLLAECAAAARMPEAAQPVIEWARKTGVEDAWLDKHLRALEDAR